MPIEFRGVHADIVADRTPERLIEGSLSSGKTTAALWAEVDAILEHRGIWSLFTRWTDDAVKTLLRPAVEQIARIRNVPLEWNRDENAYEFENGSRAFAFGLKTQSSDPLQAFSKIRGLPVSRILFDQAEQGQGGIFSELRFRLRPDLEARSKGILYPTQLTFVANPMPDDHPLTSEFPVDNHIKGRRHFALSLFSNEHNLPPTMIQSLLAQYPPSHPLYATRIMGERGLTITGVPIYENLFERALHVKPIESSDGSEWLEAFEFGKHNPVWILAQRTYHGALLLLGGIMGKRMMLEDFIPLVKRYREQWAPRDAKIRTCMSPMGSQDPTRFSMIRLVRDAGFAPLWRENANAHDVQLAMIESLSMALRRRTTNRDESLVVNDQADRWLIAFPDGSEIQRPFMSYAFEGGYCWDPHVVSVANKQLRQPRADDEYANVMRCVENLMLNFCAGRRSDFDDEALRMQNQQAANWTPFPDGPNGWMSY